MQQHIDHQKRLAMMEGDGAAVPGGVPPASTAVSSAPATSAAPPPLAGLYL